MKNMLDELTKEVAFQLNYAIDTGGSIDIEVARAQIKNACLAYAESIIPEPAKVCCGNKSPFNACRAMMLDSIRRDGEEVV